MSQLPIYFCFVLAGFYLLYLILFTPMIDNLLMRLRMSRKTVEVEEFADEIDLASVEYQRALELELAEAIVALQYLRILGLRNCLSVSNDELEKVAAPVVRFHSLPPEVREHVIRIRKERWNIS